MIDYDFIEIGTSCFDTCIEKADDDTFGLSIEPLKCYLDQLPDKKNVKKICKAITDYPLQDKIDIYYIPPDVIDNNYGLPWYLKGCNTIGDYHPNILFEHRHLFKIESVDLISIKELLISNNVRKVKYLKIDTEGHDCVILNGLYDYLITKEKLYYPKKIIFETNHLTPKNVVDNIIDKYVQLNYNIISRNENTTLEYNENI